jgi:hypothetical protein
MQRYFQRAAWLGIIGALVSFGLTYTTEPPPLARQLVERPWLDHIPRTEREPFSAYFFAQGQGRGAQPAGLLNFETRFKYTTEVFQYTLTDGRIGFSFPHDETRAESTYRIERIPPEVGRVDLKLTIDQDPRQGGGSAVFFSSSEWRRQAEPEYLKDVPLP